MKKILTISFSILALVTFAQVPQGLNYQAVVRDISSGLPKQNTNVDVKFTILQGSVNGTPVYSETHATQTNEFGLFTLTIGQGMSVDTFSNIDWASDLKFLKVEIDNQMTGTTQLWSVPYALFSGNGSQWKSNSNGIYYDAGNVGIGFPSNSINNSQFSVNGDITSFRASGGTAFVANGLQSDASYLLLRGHGGSFSDITSSWSIHRAGFDKNKLSIRYGETQFNPVYLTIDTTGKVGIGITNPQTRLSVSEQASFGNRIFVGMNSTEDGYSLLHFKNGTSSHGGIIRASQGNGDGGDAPMLYQAKNHVFSGSVGIGTSPNYKLEISGTGSELSDGVALGITKQTSKARVIIGVFPTGFTDSGFFEIYGRSGQRTTYCGSGLDNRGSFAVYNNGGNPKAQMFVNQNGQGVIMGDIKNFAIQHPLYKDKEIWYACIEGPEAAAYERGTTQLQNGQATIVLSEHFREVMNSATMTVQAIPLSADSKGLAIIEKNENGFIIKELWNGTGNYKVDWEIKAVRKGYENYKAVRNKNEGLPVLPSSASRN